MLISGTLIALKNAAFKAGYKHHHNAKQLTKSLLQTVLDELTNAGISPSRLENLKNAYSFITTHSVLSTKKKELVDLIEEVDDEINGFMETHEYFDTIGQFYIEFLRYANNDKGLGIVLTPPHITELFVELADVGSGSVVWDNCCGTGGFLISAMKKMVADSGGDSDKIENIKKSQLFGLEYQDDIFALAVSNMILHGDGKSNIQLGDTFKTANDPATAPTVGLLNPPYKSDSDDIEELEFILRNASALSTNGKCISIIPISCLSGTDAKSVALKERIMSEHTVEAVMSMPEDLFHNSKVGVITCALVLSAHVPHPESKKVWLGYWRDDGFVKVKGKGRIDAKDQWDTIKKEWLDSYRNRDEDGQNCVKHVLSPSDEWCAEAYLTTDYSTLNEAAFERALRQYVSFEISEAPAA
ncbi:MAG: N-6 DNA methylase, partial [Hyphomicrobiales bacterium]